MNGDPLVENTNARVFSLWRVLVTDSVLIKPAVTTNRIFRDIPTEYTQPQTRDYRILHDYTTRRTIISASVTQFYAREIIF